MYGVLTDGPLGVHLPLTPNIGRGNMQLLFEKEGYTKILQESLGSERDVWHEDLFHFVDHIVEKQLTRACRQSFVPYIQGRGRVMQHEIAEQLSISPNAVSQHIRKAYHTIRYEFGFAGLGYVGDEDQKLIDEYITRMVQKAMKPVLVPSFPREVFLARIDEDRLPKYVKDLLNNYLFNGDLVFGLHGSLEQISGFGRQAMQHVRDYLEAIGLGDIESVPLEVADALLQKHVVPHILLFKER